MGKKPDLNRALTQNLCLLETIPVPYPISSRSTPSSSHLPLPLSQFTNFPYAKNVSRRRSTVYNYPPPPCPHSFAAQPPALPRSPSPQRWLKNPSFHNPILALSRLSYSPQSLYKGPCSSISTVCVSRIDGLFPLLTVCSWDWNVDQPRTHWFEMTWMG